MPEYVMWILFLILLCRISQIDLQKKIIPDKYLLAAIALRVFYYWGFQEGSLKGLLVLLVQGLVVALPLLFLTLFLEGLWKRESLGGGDIKLIFVTGLYLGWEYNLWMLLIAAGIGLGGRLIARKEEFPFGPLIALATGICTIFRLLHRI